MPFPVELKYIKATEEMLGVKFPPIYIERMLKVNGGELEGDNYFFMLNPFFDKSNKKRIKRTCNDIVNETKSARGYGDIFPESAVSIGSDNYGNQILLLKIDDVKLGEAIYFWDHETGAISKVAESLLNFGE